MEWHTLLSKKRLGKEEELRSLGGGRTEFESDVDRITFSSAFRRLGRKTQVHPLAANDHVHTRLTHSLEVAHVGRALGKALGTRIAGSLPSGVTANDLAEIVKAACLAHDIGNPPFGHAGESAMAHWFSGEGKPLFRDLNDEQKNDLLSFEGNAQGFRVLTQTENHLFRGGLQLTYATLGTFHKYPWTSGAKRRKFGSFIAEGPILEKVASELGLVCRGSRIWCRHPLAYLVEAADDICYAIIDLEDAVELRILQLDQVVGLLLSPFDSKERERIKAGFASKDSHRVNLARLRGPVFDSLLSATMEGYLAAYDRIMEGTYEGSVFESLAQDDARRKLIQDAKQMAREFVFRDEKKIEIELGCCSTFETLLKAFCEAALNRSQELASETGEIALQWKSELVLRLLGDHSPGRDNPPPGSSWTPYQCLRRVIDFVSGMTDNYAVYVAQQIRGTGFSGVHRP